MLKRGFLIMLCSAMIFSLFGCGAAPAETTNDTSVTETTVPAATTEPTEPDDGSIKFYYDDRISYEELGAAEAAVITVKDQQIDSTIVGSSDPDNAILYFDEASKQYIAVGVGTATLDIDGKEVLIRVRPAPISLFMITGHSLGAGQCGNAAQSVVSEAGRVYSCHKTASFQEATAEMGIGFAAPAKPAGIDAFAPGGGGTIGEGSALAWKWNQLTGEKVWVLNAAVGGSVIPEWIKGEKYYEPAAAMYRAAAQVLANEVAAGHYKLKNCGIIYHSAANFGYKNVEYTDEVMEFWYDSMYNGFKQDVAIDITGDGTPDAIEFIGFIPSGAANDNHDKPINYYMALTDTYDCFMLAETMRRWKENGKPSKYFPAIEYTETQSEPVTMPATEAEMYAEDNVHFTQVVYNAAGLEIAQNLYNYLRTDVKLEDLDIVTSKGVGVKDSLTFKRVGSTHSLIAVPTPYYAANFTITYSDNLELISPFTFKAKAEGEGFITISKGDEVIRHITVTVGE